MIRSVNLCLAATLLLTWAGSAIATPSSQIWIPSTDVQAFKTFHLGIDNFIRASGVGRATGDPSRRDPNVYDIGLVAGFLPFAHLKGEIGFDYIGTGTEPNDNHPWSGNVKIGTPESSLFGNSPAVAIGGYNLGPSLAASVAPGVTAGQNIWYGLVAKTIPSFGSVPSPGRVSVGYYGGSEKALTGPRKADGTHDADGLLASWDRTMTEISGRLWMGVDYMGGRNVDSSVNLGFSWNFAKNVSVIFGYDVYLEKSLAGNNTFNTQLNIDFP